MPRKFLLIKPPYKYYPIGLSYVASTLDRNGIPFDFLDLSDPNSDMEAALRENEYMAVGSGGLVADFNSLHDIFELISKVKPGIPRIMGGHITRDVTAETIFSHIPIDVMVVRDAEDTLPELLKAISTGQTDYEGIKGVVYRNSQGAVIRNQPRPRMNPADGGVFPSYDFIDHYAWIKAGKSVPIMTGRGCPGACTFCSPSHRTFIARPLEDVFKEIEAQRDRFGVRHFEFSSEVFFDTEKQLIDFCHAFKERIGLTFTCLLRCDMDPSVLKILHDSGCNFLSVGIESGSDKVLRRMGKRINTDLVRNFVREAKKAGITKLESGWILNNETESEEDIALTLDFRDELNIRSCLGFTVPYPGTPIFKHASRKGLIKSEYEFLRQLTTFYTVDFLPDVLFIETPEGKSILPNLTDIPDKDFVRVMSRAYARYVSSYALRATSLSQKNGALIMHGECPVCNRAIDYQYDAISPLHRNLACPGVADGTCWNDWIFHANIFTLPHIAAYAKQVAERVKDHRVAVFGDSFIIKFIFAFNIFNLDINNVVGMATRTPGMEGRYLYADGYGNARPNSKFMTPRELRDQKPGTVLALEMPPGSLALRDILLGVGFPKDKIVLMTPESLFAQ
jgi:radical SAM superfamily enzyme YgiQ (UPF0313 family)